MIKDIESLTIFTLYSFSVFFFFFFFFLSTFFTFAKLDRYEAQQSKERGHITPDLSTSTFVQTFKQMYGKIAWGSLRGPDKVFRVSYDGGFGEQVRDIMHVFNSKIIIQRSSFKDLTIYNLTHVLFFFFVFPILSGCGCWWSVS